MQKAIDEGYWNDQKVFFFEGMRIGFYEVMKIIDKMTDDGDVSNEYKRGFTDACLNIFKHIKNMKKEIDK